MQVIHIHITLSYCLFVYNTTTKKRAYKDIADCYYIKAAKVCGKEAAKVMKRVVRTVVDSIITVQCNFIMDPIVEDAFSSTTVSHPHLPTIIMITIALYPVAAPLLRYLNK